MLTFAKQTRCSRAGDLVAPAAWVRRSVGLGPVHPAADIGLDERLMLGTERLTGGLR